MTQLYIPWNSRLLSFCRPPVHTGCHWVDIARSTLGRHFRASECRKQESLIERQFLLAERSSDTLHFGWFWRLSLFRRLKGLDSGGQWKPRHDVMDGGPGGPAFHRQSVAVNDPCGNAPERRVHKRHVTGGATYVHGRDAQAAADFGCAGSRERQNHGACAARRLANGDWPLRAVIPCLQASCWP